MVVREDAEVACPPYTALVEDPLILIDFEWTSEGSFAADDAAVCSAA